MERELKVCLKLKGEPGGRPRLRPVRVVSRTGDSGAGRSAEVVEGGEILSVVAAEASGEGWGPELRSVMGPPGHPPEADQVSYSIAQRQGDSYRRQARHSAVESPLGLSELLWKAVTWRNTSRQFKLRLPEVHTLLCNEIRWYPAAVGATDTAGFQFLY